jgi:putative hemolysin
MVSLICKGASRHVLAVLLLILACCTSWATVGCSSSVIASSTRSQESSAQMANPASINCTKQGGVLSIRKRADGSEYGLCTFQDKSECEEWALYRGECKRGAGAVQESYDNPYSYCAAVGTIEEPDRRYSGAAVPDPVIRGMVRQGMISADAPQEFKEKALWRCANGNVLVCHQGANLPCSEKADTSRAPSSAIRDFCKARLEADNIPAVVTGRATIYAWRCENGEPAIVRQLFKVDGQGYLAEFWIQLTPE